MLTRQAAADFAAAQRRLDQLVVERMTYPRAEYVQELREAIRTASSARRHLAIYSRWIDLDKEETCP